MAKQSRYFVATADQPRARRFADALTLAIGLFLVAITAGRADELTALEEALVDVAVALPSWTRVLWAATYSIAALYALVMVVAVLARGRREPDAARDVLLALAIAVFATIVLRQIFESAWPAVLPELQYTDADPRFPILRVAIVTAVVTALAPHVTRPVRRFGGLLVALAAIAGFGLGFGFPSDAVGAIGIGIASAGAVLLLFGSPRGYPDIDSVRAALAELGLIAEELRVAPDQSWGTRRIVGVLEDGSPIEIKAYGRDASDSQFFAKLWRVLWYRDAGPSLSFSRLQSVEHEALVTLFAAETGIPTPDVLAAAMGGDDVALLALDGHGTPLGEADIDDETLVALWANVARLHAGRISHGNLTVEAVRIVDGSPVVRDYDRGSLAVDETRLLLDIPQLLFSLAMAVGPDRAVASASRGLGTDTLAATLPFLQVPALSRHSRRHVKRPKARVKALRDLVVEATGAELPEPVKLRRVSWGNVLMAALLLFAASALLGMLGDIDFAAVWEVVQDARWPAIVVAFIVGQFVFVPDATGMLAAVGYPLPLRPLIVLQVSAKFIGLAIPSAAGRIAMNTAFLVKFGVTPTLAVTQGAIDGVSGFVVEAGILLAAFVFGGFDLGLEFPQLDWGLILLALVLLAVAAVLVVLRIRRLRTLVVPIVRQAAGSVGGVLKDPKRALALLGSNLASRVILGIVLWMILGAVDVHVSFAVALTVTVATNLLAGLVPVPGGIGVAEAVMTSWLILAGVPEAEAFAATVVFRVATFYIPAVEGWPALRWLERRDYL